MPTRPAYGAVTSPSAATSVDFSVNAPVAVSVVYRRPVLPSAYNAASAGRTSMPTMFSPACCPVSVTLVHTFCGSAALKDTSLFVSVSAVDVAGQLRRRGRGRGDGGITHQLIGVEPRDRARGCRDAGA